MRFAERKALLAGWVTTETYGRALLFERVTETLEAVVRPIVLGKRDPDIRYTARVNL